MSDNILTKFHIEGLDIKTWMVRIKKQTPIPSKKQDKTLAFPLCLYSISNTKGIKNSKRYSLGINKHFNFVEYIDKILKIENALP